MNKLENRIRDILSKEINIPTSYENAIHNAMQKKEKERHKVFKLISASCVGILLLTGMVFASYIAYEKIWKEPQKLTSSEVRESFNTREISQEEKDIYITENTAISKALNILKNLGYSNLEESSLQLENSNNINYYTITTKGSNHFSVVLNAETGDLIGLNNLDITNTDTKIISKEEAENIAKSICDKAQISNISKYELQYCKEEYTTNVSKVWTASFNKKYNNIYNPYDSIKILFYVTNSKIEIYSITINSDNNFSDNEIIISKEKAQEIAINKEKELSQLEIIDIQTELAIRKMNTFIYKLENNITRENNNENDENSIIYKIDNISRNVWIVRIKHNERENMKFENSIEYSRQMDKKYFIDVTTGEIIGGEDFFENTNNPLYN